MPLIGPDRHPRLAVPLAAVLTLAAAAACEPEAFAQRIAQQFDQQSAGPPRPR